MAFRSYRNYNFPPDHIYENQAKKIVHAVEAEQRAVMHMLAPQIANETRRYHAMRNEITNKRLTLEQLQDVISRNEKQFYPYYPAVRELENPSPVPLAKTQPESFVRKFVGNIETTPIYSGTNRSVC